MSEEGSEDEGSEEDDIDHLGRDRSSLHTEDTELMPNFIFNMMSERRDRYILYLLHYSQNTLDAHEIVEQITALEHGIPPNQIPNEIHNPIQTAIFHIHLPKLDASGVVEWDEHNQEVRITEVGEKFGPILDFFESYEVADIGAFLQFNDDSKNN